MKFVTLAKTFTATNPSEPLLSHTIEKGTRFGIRNGNMFQNGDHGYHGNFHRVMYWGYGSDLVIPYEYLTEKSVKTLKEVSLSP